MKRMAVIFILVVLLGIWVPASAASPGNSYKEIVIDATGDTPGSESFLAKGTIDLPRDTMLVIKLETVGGTGFQWEMLNHLKVKPVLRVVLVVLGDRWF